MNLKWSDCTFLAWEEQGGRCTLCGERIYLKYCCFERRLIGHHIQNRSKGGHSIPENCEARHWCCEQIAHKIARDGNPTPQRFLQELRSPESFR